MVSELGAWIMGAFGSLTGGTVVAWYLGDQQTKEKILFITPFLAIGIIGVYNILSNQR